RDPCGRRRRRPRIRPAKAQGRVHLSWAGRRFRVDLSARGRPAIRGQGARSKVETTYLENVNEGPDSERSIEQLARSGHKLIFTTSFGYMDPTIKVAKKYP